MNYFGLMTENFFDGNVEGKATVTDIWQYYVTAAYHSKCLIDSSTNTYCLFSPLSPGFTQPALLNTSSPDTLCKENSCGTQSAYLFAPIKTIYKYDPTNVTESREGGDLPMLSLEEACPGIDTSEYPLREEDVTAEMLKSGSTSGDSKTGGDKPSAAVLISVSSGNVVAAVVVGLVGLLTL